MDVLLPDNFGNFFGQSISCFWAMLICESVWEPSDKTGIAHSSVFVLLGVIDNGQMGVEYEFLTL